MTAVDPLRVRVARDLPERPDGDYVLYWMTAARRTAWNHAFDHAVARACALDLPLLVFEPLRAGYRWASVRFHRFVADGMCANRDALADTGIGYYPYLEPQPGDGQGLLAALAARAALVVGDEAPVFFLPHMAAAAARQVDARLELVDGNGLLPLRAGARAFPTAHSFRTHLQKSLPPHLDRLPVAAPPARRSLDGLPAAEALPAELLERWPAAELDDLDAALEAIPLDREVFALHDAGFPGGAAAGDARLRAWIADGLARYADDRNDPDHDGPSGLSPYLHFGHVGAAQVFRAVADAEGWSPADLAEPLGGKRAGWWGMGESAEGFLDQLVTWRELGFQFSAHYDGDPESWQSLPEWARTTMEEHAGDSRTHVYTLEEFEQARTHDELWNAAQRQLRQEGRIHNYLRMLWGKMIFAWSESPQEALRILVQLNHRWALDGRDPNSSSGICWVLGRHDRAWGPEREVFGKIRYMTSANTRRKLKLAGYLERYGPESTARLY
jgi:deoxyribodipyrimidine photo-lyase